MAKAAMNTSTNITIDTLDLRLLQALQNDARLSTAELGEQLALSQSPTWRRLKRLEQEGVITGYQAVLDRRKLGLPVLAVVHISMDSHDDKTARKFEEVVQLIPEVALCHYMSGSEDFMLMVVARDLDHFTALVMDKLRKLPAVKSLRSSFSMRAIKDNIAIKLDL
jgi:Lrp/AsnC family transcriptional regulator, leucine-responsive regulatory protein